MLAHFLLTELRSERLGTAIQRLLGQKQLTPAIIEHPDLNVLSENDLRADLLGEWRGYGRDGDVFKGFPDDGREALSSLGQSADVPKVILLDITMPPMTGWEFVRAVQRDARLAAIPIVIMTALGALEHNEIPAGAVAFLKKPLDLVALEMILRVYAEPRLRLREVGG